MSDYTTEHRLNLEAYLSTHALPKGLRSKEGVCTLAAINFAMSGRLTDDIPDCMSEVLGKAAIRLQDAMPDKMRNSARYKALILDMPGTGRAHEKERLAILMDWMWSTVLPQVQPLADKKGFGSEWQKMCHDKMPDAARDARAAAAGALAAARAALAALAAARAAYLAAADAALWALWGARAAADAALWAARAVEAHGADFWLAVDPIGVLERMTYLTGGQKDEVRP